MYIIYNYPEILRNVFLGAGPWLAELTEVVTSVSSTIKTKNVDQLIVRVAFIENVLIYDILYYAPEMFIAILDAASNHELPFLFEN